MAVYQPDARLASKSVLSKCFCEQRHSFRVLRESSMSENKHDSNGGNTEVTLEVGPLLTVIAKQDKTSG